MRILNCFVITPSGKNPPMRLVADEKYGWSAAPSSCQRDHAQKEIHLNFQEVYEGIILPAIKEVNDANPGTNIKCTRGEDLTLGGNIVSQFLREICRAEITITDITGLNPNVLLEYGIRLSVRDSLNILLCHEDVIPPVDIADQRYIEYRTDKLGSAKKARDEIVATIHCSLPTLLKQETPESVENLFRRTVELATGRTLERQLTTALEPVPALLVDLINELKRLDTEGKVRDDPALRADPQLRNRTWKFLETIGNIVRNNSPDLGPAIKHYELMTKLGVSNEKLREVFYALSEICATDPNRETEAKKYRDKAKELED